MTIKIGDVCHIKRYGDGYWIGKVAEIHEKIDDYQFEYPIIYIFAVNEDIPNFRAIYEYAMKLVDNEYWEI